MFLDKLKQMEWWLHYIAKSLLFCVFACSSEQSED